MDYKKGKPTLAHSRGCVETSQNQRADQPVLGQVGLRMIRGTEWQRLQDHPSTPHKMPDFSVTASFRFGSGVFTFKALSISQLNVSAIPFFVPYKAVLDHFN